MLLLNFVVVLVAVFGALTLASRPTPEQKSVDRRFACLRAEDVAGLHDGGDAKGFWKQQGSTQGAGPRWMHAMLWRYGVTQKVQALHLQSGCGVSLGTLALRSAAGGVAAGFAAFVALHSLWVALACVALSGYAPVALLSIKRRRRTAAFNAALPEAIDLLARSLRAGHAVVAALGSVADHAVAPVSVEFAEVFRQQNFGLPLRDALLQLLERVPSQDLRVVVTGILVQKDTGGNLAEILDRIAFVIRERLRIQGEIRTHTAQGRMTGWILCLLPVVMLVLINIVNPGYSRVLFEDPLGKKLLYAGIGLLTVGSLLIRKIVNGIEV